MAAMEAALYLVLWLREVAVVGQNGLCAERTAGTVKPYYSENGITIYHGDCRDVLPSIGRFDLLLTDPPYGIGESSKKQATRQGHGLAKQKDYGSYDWDSEPLSQDRLQLALDSCEEAIVWGGNYFPMKPSSCWLVWDKDNGATDFADCELAWTSLRKAVRRFKYKWQGMLQERMGDQKETRVHPTQKPLPLMRWCLSHVPEAYKVLDICMGSGTTLLAARLEGRSATGIEGATTEELRDYACAMAQAWQEECDRLTALIP